MLPPTPANEPDFVAFLAIDWADREHAWALEIPGARQRERGKLEHTPEAIDAWAAALASRFQGRPIAVALEQARGALLYALSKYTHLVLYPIHPTTSSRYRAAMFPSGSKDDPKDTDLLLDLLTRHRDHLRPLQPDTEQTRKLQLLVEKRRQLVDQRTAQTNRITDLLKVYLPQILKWFDKIDSPLVGAVLERWPTLEKLQAASEEELRQFFYQHQSRSQERIEQRIQDIQAAQPAIVDHAIIDPCLLTVKALLGVVAALREGIASLDKTIQEVANSHPDYPIFASFPAAAAVMAPRLLVAFGARRDRYTSANQVHSYSGIAPVISRSGDSQFWVHFRWACPKFLRQTFHEYAALSIQHCPWARAFYDQQRSKGKGHHAAVRSLAFKWIRIQFRCWQSGTPYDEATYLRARESRQAPAKPQPGGSDRRHRSAGSGSSQPSFPQLGLACAGTVNIQFKKVGGFFKFSGTDS